MSRMKRELHPCATLVPAGASSLPGYRQLPCSGVLQRPNDLSSVCRLDLVYLLHQQETPLISPILNKHSEKTGTGERSGKPRVLAELSEDLGSTLITHVMAHRCW